MPSSLSSPLFSFVVAIAALLGTEPPTDAGAQETIQDQTRAMESQDGFLSLHWDPDEGRLLVEIPTARLERDFLYMRSLATGVGSNELGLDRGEIGSEFIARFERAGPRVFLVLRNPSFRVESEPEPAHRVEALRRSVEESFPTSTVGGFEVVAEDEGSVLVDMTEFFLADAMDVAGALQRDEQGSFRVETSRSRIHRPRTKAFPDNTEVEASLTFVADGPGREVRRHAPDGRALTLRQHHSFVRLPDDGYEPRRFDPRIGLFAVRFFDYGRSLEDGYGKRWIVRHRLEKADPGAERSRPVEPIVYYLDPAVPEPYRSAFVEGGTWWNRVLEAAGWIDAFRIEEMPADMDPLDARYNVIQWVHRTKAGSSIGPSFVDPRTGEIIKAAVRMDSHRSLVDHNIWAGTVPATAGGSAGFEDRSGDVPGRLAGADGAMDWMTALDPNVGSTEFAMARRKQHSAHEIGHTLGLAHNFIAVSYGRASVMDYPAPLIELEDGRIDLSDAYRDGPGLYDTLAVRYAYTEFADEEVEAAGLDAIIREAMDRGVKFITNPDARDSDSYPDASWWINGTDVLDELERVRQVRRHLLERFDETAVAPGEPLWRLRERLVPVYLHHRYTLDAAVKTLGGMEYRYAVRGDPLPPTRVLPPARQQRALALLLETLRPEALAIPESVLDLMAPRPFGYAPDDRAYASRADPGFDQLGVARTLAEKVLGGMLHPARAARLVAFHDRDPGLPSLVEVVGRIVGETWSRPARGSHAGLVRVVQRVVVDELIELAYDDGAAVEARAAAEWGLRRVAEQIAAGEPVDETDAAHRELSVADIQRFLERRHQGVERTAPLDPPPGTPIGDRPPGE